MEVGYPPAIFGCYVVSYRDIRKGCVEFLVRMVDLLGGWPVPYIMIQMHRHHNQQYSAIVVSKLLLDNVSAMLCHSAFRPGIVVETYGKR
jgi:hypothetical protein